MSEIDLGTIKNGSAASDLPPKGSKKKSWADLTHLARFAKTKPRDYQKWIRSVRFTPGGSELRTQDSGLRTRNSELRTQNSGLRTRTSELRTQDSGLRTQDSGLRTQDSELRTQDSGLGTQNSGLRNVRFLRGKVFSVTCNVRMLVRMAVRDAYSRERDACTMFL